MPEDLTVAKGTYPGVNGHATQTLTTDEAIAAMLDCEALCAELRELDMIVSVGLDGRRYSIPAASTGMADTLGVYFYFTKGPKEHGDWAYTRMDVSVVLSIAIAAARRLARDNERNSDGR